MSKAHSRLEGISNCTKCHDLGNQVTDKKCLDCHEEISKLIKKEKGYHSSREVKNKDCRTCHSEHFGRDFRLIKFNEKNFDHSLSGFNLTGKHSTVNCNKCHTSRKTYLGLSQDCKSCHDDFHLGALGNNCTSCHSTNSFKAAEYFDHNKTNFKLVQAHTNVNCGKCHKPEIREGKRFQKFKALSFTNCFPCHNDVHNNKFGKDCKSCHVMAGFKFVNKAAFDHSKTRFPLLGKHISVTCNSCHKNSISEKPAFNKCNNCHEDYHSGEFTSDAVIRNCGECHSVNGFTPALFTLEDHNKLSFKLEGKHPGVECSKCHLNKNKWHFRIEHKDCADCHSNIHKNEISENILNDGCHKCHSVQGWTFIKFDHSVTDFKLTGRHSALSCRQCHYNETVSGYSFSSINSRCESCHKDKHNGQFQTNSVTDCSRCHSTENWTLQNFNHDLTRFKLDGKHKETACNKCHQKVFANGLEYTRYKMDNIKCSACHFS